MTSVPAPNRYVDMTYRRTRRSGLIVPAPSLGLRHNFGHERPIERTMGALASAVQQGEIDKIEPCAVHGTGLS